LAERTCASGASLARATSGGRPLHLGAMFAMGGLLRPALLGALLSAAGANTTLTNGTGPIASERCPEPVRSMLWQGKLWGLEVEHHCSGGGGHAAFHGMGPGIAVSGEWRSICMEPGNASLTIRSSYAGVWEGCSGDADCMHIRCATKCMPCYGSDCHRPSVCTPQGLGCSNETVAMLSPDDFRAACPADARDVVCMHIEHSWEMAGCRVFQEPGASMPPDAKEKAI